MFAPGDLYAERFDGLTEDGTFSFVLICYECSARDDLVLALAWLELTDEEPRVIDRTSRGD